MSDAINPDHYKRLPAEAIEIIESAIEGAPTSQEAYLQGQALKYLLRANHKNGREDIHKAKWYLDRMVASFTVPSNLLDHPSSPTKPPDGWRWLEVGEVIRKGDLYFKDHEWIAYDLWVGGKIAESDRPSIRRNRFEVGEKVVDFCGQVWEVEYIFDTGNRYRLKNKDVRDERYGNSLAPYIEDAT